MWTCPHCRLPLLATPDGASLACDKRHTFDRAREGYVNLLPSNRKRSANPGDNPHMVAARARVHAADAYAPMAAAMVAELSALSVAGPVLDLGCGEGYYCGVLDQALPACALYGVDISRAAVRLAARRCPAADFAVASAFDLPLPDASLEVVLRVFAPSDDAQVLRVLRPGGFYLEICPAPGHLKEVRARLYDTPREHVEAREDVQGLQLVKRSRVQYPLALDAELLSDLVSMTPFAFRGHREKRERLLREALPEVSMAFSLHLFQKAS